MRGSCAASSRPKTGESCSCSCKRPILPRFATRQKPPKRAIMSPCSAFWGRFYSRRRRTPSSGAGRKPWTICNLRSSSCSPIRSSSRSWPRWRQRSAASARGRPAAPAAAETAGTGRSKAARCAAAAGRAKAAHAAGRPAGKAADGTAAFLEAGAPGKSSTGRCASRS